MSTTYQVQVMGTSEAVLKEEHDDPNAALARMDELYEEHGGLVDVKVVATRVYEVCVRAGAQ